jgi:hypothetical protein
MATEITIKNDNGRQVEITVELENDQNWEEKCYQVGCQVAKEIARQWVKAMAERLFQERDRELSVECTRGRIRVTRFGRISVSRRTYSCAQLVRMVLGAVDSRDCAHYLLGSYQVDLLEDRGYAGLVCFTRKISGAL